MTIKIPHLGKLAARKHLDEARRLEDLRAARVLDTAAERRFDQIAELIATVLDVPMAAISFVDDDRQWFKAKYGFDHNETPREVGFCQHAILEDDMLVVEDLAAHPEFSINPLVVGEPGLRFYAAAVVRSDSGRPLGTCAALDVRPRRFTERERSFLHLLARMVETELRVTKDIGSLKRQVRTLSMLDNETGLPNLELFRKRLTAEIDAAKKSQPFLLALIRVDRFDSLDAALGRDAANYVIGHLAARVRARLGKPCFIAQPREDKLALLTRVSEARRPGAILEKVLECSAEPVVLGTHSVPITTSIGASVYPSDAEDADSLLKRARTALWSRPPSGRSGYRFYQRKHSDRASGEFRVITALQDAVANDEFHLVYQPKVDVEQSRLIGAEALLRWRSPVLGDVPPGTFIPIAERSDRIVDIGNWVLLRACRQLRKWNTQPYPIPEISINVTSHQIRQPDFVDRVAHALLENELPGSQLNIEITESSLIDDLPGAVRIMEALRGLGVSISIDDFGTGFSSLSYLNTMPLQVLKIDRSFIGSVATDRSDRRLVRSIVSMGKDLELRVIAEGVETPEQLAFLRSIGCTQIQGFIFSPPLLPDELTLYARNSDYRPVDAPLRSIGSQ